MSTTEAALRIVAAARSPEDIRAACAALEPGDARLRAALFERFDRLAADGPRLDPTTSVRTEILSALRSEMLAADLGRLEAAATHYELGYSGELAGPLRAAALVGMADVDPGRARLHAVHLLADSEHTNPMSGEPALTAARLLAAQRETAVLYQRALDGAPGEVLGECLRALTELPVELALALARQLSPLRDETALLGLVDLVLGHPDPALAGAFLPGWLPAQGSLELYAYAATAAVASRRPDLRRLVEQLRETEVRRDRKLVLEEALSL